MFRYRAAANRLYLAALAAGFLAWLGGSAIAVSIITRTDITPFYSLSEVMIAKRNGGLPAEIHGAPSATASPADIAAPLRLPSRVGGGRLVPFGPEDARPGGTRLVLLFNAENLSARTACRNPAATGARRMDGGLDVFAVLCHDNRYFSQAHLRDSSVTGPADPSYVGSMTRLLLALMPSKDQVERDSGNDGRN